MQRKPLAIRAMSRLGQSAVLERSAPVRPICPSSPSNRGAEKPSNINSLPQLPQIKNYAREKTNAESPLRAIAISPEKPGQPGRAGQPVAEAGFLAAPVRHPTGAHRGDRGAYVRGQPRRNPNACAHCGKHCEPSNLENWIGPDGRWHHLDCELAQP
jgi:hypothetical protein